jgi:hypothetical protein
MTPWWLACVAQSVRWGQQCAAGLAAAETHDVAISANWQSACSALQCAVHGDLNCAWQCKWQLRLCKDGVYAAGRVGWSASMVHKSSHLDHLVDDLVEKQLTRVHVARAVPRQTAVDRVSLGTMCYTNAL